MANANDTEKISYLQKLYEQLIGLSGGRDAFNERAAKYVKGGDIPSDLAGAAFSESPFKTKVDLGKGITGNSLKNTLGMAGSAIKAHPWASAGMGALGAANVAGLVDDDKIAGQLVGGLGSGVIANLAGVSPMASLAIGLGGGTLGSLFDKLRAKKELEQQSMHQQQEY